MRYVAQLVCAFPSAAVPFNVIESFRNSDIDVVVDGNHLYCRVILGLSRCRLNPASPQPVPIPDETKDEASEKDTELYVEECYDLLYDFDTPNDENE
jgi:hypothetical protein